MDKSKTFILFIFGMFEDYEDVEYFCTDIIGELPFIKTVRGKGLLNAIVVEHSNPNAAWDLCLHLKNNGILAKPTHGDKIRFAPPLIINEAQIQESVSMISKSLKHLELN